MAKIRIIGTALGCIAGMAVQLILGSWFGYGLLFWLWRLLLQWDLSACG